MNLLSKQLSYLALMVFSALSMATVSYADQVLNTPKSIILEVKLSHETNGDLEGATALQINFQGVDSDSNVISFNPETGSTSTDVPLTRTVTFASGEGSVPLTLKEGVLKSYSAIQIKIALDSSPTDFILIPFSSTIFALQSLEAERLTETSLFQVDPENEQIKIKNLVLMDDSSVYNDRTDFVSAAANSGITVNATNQIGILAPTAPGTPITYLSYNTGTNNFDWRTIAVEGDELTQYTADQGVTLNSAVFKIDISHADTTPVSDGAVFTWDNANTKPRWISTNNFFPHTGSNGIEVEADHTIKLVDELTWTGTDLNVTGNANLTGSIRVGNNVSPQEGTIRYDSGVFYGFSGTAWEILNTDNVSISLDESNLWATTNPNTTWSHTVAAIERVGILTNSPKKALDVNGEVNIESHATIGGNIQADGNLDIDGTENSTFAGNIQADGNLDIDGTGNSTFAGNVNITGTLVAQNIAQDDTLDRLLVVSATATDPIRYRALSSLGSPAGDVGVTLNATSGEYELEQLVQGSGTLADHYELTWAGDLATGEPKWRKPYTGARGIDIDTDDDDRIIQITNTDADDNDIFVWDTNTAKWESLSNLMNSLTIASATITSLKMNTSITDANLNIQPSGGKAAIIVNVGGTAAANRKFIVNEEGNVFVNKNSIAIPDGVGALYEFGVSGTSFTTTMNATHGEFGLLITGDTTKRTSLRVKDTAENNEPVFDVHDGTDTYFSVNQDKTITLIKHTEEPVDCSEDHDGKIFLTDAYILCVCNGTNWVRTSDGSVTTNCLN